MSVTIAIVSIFSNQSYQTKVSLSSEIVLEKTDPSSLIKQAPNEPAYLPNMKFSMPGPFVEVNRDSSFFSKIYPLTVDSDIVYTPKVRNKKNKKDEDVDLQDKIELDEFIKEWVDSKTGKY
jgi:hypothetical protein